MPIYTHKVTVNPMGVLTDGFVGYDGAFAISGYGLTTFGFIWGVNDIWTPVEVCQDTVWTACDCSEECD